MSDLPLRWNEYIAGAPQRQADLFISQARLPFIGAQTGLAQAQTTKELVDAQMAYLLGQSFLNTRAGLTGSNSGMAPQSELNPGGAEPGTQPPGAGGAPAPPAAPGGGGGPATGPGPSTPVSGLTGSLPTDPSLNYAWLGPRVAASSMLSGMSQPAQMAAATPTPGADTLARMPGGDSIFLGATTAQPVAGRPAAPMPAGIAPSMFLGASTSQPTLGATTTGPRTAPGGAGTGAPIQLVPPYQPGMPSGPPPPRDIQPTLPVPAREGEVGPAGPQGGALPPSLQFPPQLRRQMEQQGFPLTPPQGSTQLQQQAGQGNPDTTASSAGIWEPAVGMVVPKTMDMWFQQMAMPRMGGLPGGGDPAGAARWLTEQHNNAVLRLLENVHSDADWKQAVSTAYLSGLISLGQYNRLYNNPWMQPSIKRMNSPPEEVMRMDQYEAAYNKRVWDATQNRYIVDPNAAWQWLQEHMPTSAPGAPGTGTRVPTFPFQTFPGTQLPGAPGFNAPDGGGTPPGGGAPGGGAAAPGKRSEAAPAGPVPSGAFTAYASKLQPMEGGDTGTPNRFTGASGPYQFHPATRPDVAREALPQVVAGMTNAQINAHKFTPDEEFKMLRTFTGNNARALEARGQPASAANLFLSHRLGAEGFQQLRNLPQNAMMAAAFPKEAAVNPDMRGVTAGQFAQRAIDNYGQNILSSRDIAMGVAPPEPAPRPAQVPSVPPPGGVQTAGAPQYGLPPGYNPTPQFAPGISELVRHYIDTDNKAVEVAGTDAARAGDTLQTYRNMHYSAEQIGPGGFGTGGEFRASAYKLASTILQNNPGMKSWADKWLSTDFKNEAQRQEFIKQSIRVLTQQEAQLPGVRTGIGLSEFMKPGSVNIDMEKATADQLINFAMVGAQRTLDYYQDMNDRVTKAGIAYRNDPLGTPYQPIERQVNTEYTAGDTIHSLKVYEAAYRVMNGDRNWNEQLGDGPMGREQQAEAVRIARRIIPNWTTTLKAP